MAQPDIVYIGGITEMKKVATLAETYQVVIAPHNTKGPVGIMAAAHVMASIPNALIQECQRASKAIEAQLLVNQAGHLEQAAETARIQLEQSEETLKEFSEVHGLIDPGLQATDRLRQIRDVVSLRDARHAG